MKKIVCLLLALTCMFSLLACNGDEMDSIFYLVESSDPTSIKTQTTHTRPGGVSYGGVYETKMDGKGFVFTYSYEEMAPITPGTESSDSLLLKEGTVEFNGSLYSINGGEWTAVAPEVSYMQLKLELTPDAIGDYTLSKDGKTLTAELSKDEVAAVFGAAVDAETATLQVVVDSVHLTRVILEYTTANGTQVIVETSYSYEALPAESAPEAPDAQ